MIKKWFFFFFVNSEKVTKHKSLAEFTVPVEASDIFTLSVTNNLTLCVVWYFLILYVLMALT